MPRFTITIPETSFTLDVCDQDVRDFFTDPPTSMKIPGRDYPQPSDGDLAIMVRAMLHDDLSPAADAIAYKVNDFTISVIRDAPKESTP